MPWRRTRSAPPSMAYSRSPIADRARRPRQLLEPGAAHQRALVLLVEHPLGLGQQRAVLPRRHCRDDVDLDLHGHARCLGRRIARHLIARPCARPASPSKRIFQCSEGFDQLEGKRAGAEDPRPAVGARRGRGPCPGRSTLKTRPSAMAMLTWTSWVSHWSATASTPIRGRPTSVAAVPDPGVHRLPHLGVLGLSREDELAVLTQTTRQIGSHIRLPWARPGTPAGGSLDTGGAVGQCR